ncbi:MAG TPA: hypothetical protein VGD72_13820 [Mycobacteriales bacterium]|jgi:hypothetical protein
MTRVALEVGTTWVFASSLDWPGWCRRGRGEEGALDALVSYADRYAAVAGPGFAPGEPTVVGRSPGDATTDFGAPSVVGPWDSEPLDPAEAARLADLLAACWSTMDGVVAGAPAELRRGPRGGGRDRDAVTDHVREAERAYGRKLGVRVAPRTPWGEQREALLAVLRAGAPDGTWPARYGFRRLAWHVLDHAWEIEDKST